MTIDRSIMYVCRHEDDTEVGDYIYHMYMFEHWSHYDRLRRIVDHDALERFRTAKDAYLAAERALWEASLPIDSAPPLPPVPDGFASNEREHFDALSEMQGSCECDHWHVHVCDCGGECACHRRKT